MDTSKLKGKTLTPIWVYDKVNGDQIDYVKADTVLDVLYTAESGKWIKHKLGWSPIVVNGVQVIQLYKSGSGDDDGKQLASSGLDPEKYKEDEDKKDSDFVELDDMTLAGYQVYISGTDASGKKIKINNDTITTSFLTNCRGVYGMPYQYMSEVDPKLPNSDYGAMFTDMILTRMPLLILSPGKPMFMQGYSDQNKKDVISFMGDKLKNTVDDLLDIDGKNPGKYYSFGYSYDEYYKYVNPMCQAAAQFLGIGEYKIDGTQLKDYKWQNYTQSSLRNFISSNESICFYIDSETQVSESFSNDTGDSMLASKVNELSDLSKEVQYLMGGMAGIDMEKFQSNMETTKSEFEQFQQKYMSGKAGKTLLGNLIDTGLTSVVCGGKMIFPEIWKSSSYSNDYDVTVKLRTPDCDPVSWFLNICVPMMMLVCLVCPQSMGYNAYKSPFIIKGFYKGFFNCQMGIISNMTISRGDKGKWTLSGLPTQVDINFTIKDLYKTLTLTKTTEGFISMDFVRNTYLVDWIGNNCGININKPDILRSAELWMNMINNNLYNKVTFDGFSGIKNRLSNLVDKFYN